MMDATTNLKGKAREAAWFDFQSLLDTPRPVAWASTSVLFYPHPSQPLVAARHLSSTKQFSLPSPSPILSAQTSYDPPTVISVSPAGDWLFAYFPSGDTDMDGVGCLWYRSAPIDAWAVRQFWSFHPGAGVVGATWLNLPREWIVDDAGAITRLPPRGPQTPLSNPTFVLVTEDRMTTVCYLPQYEPTFRMVKCSVTEPGTSADTLNASGPSTVKLCTRAAVGFAYNDSAIVIATRSKTLASEPKTTPLPTTMNLALDLEMPPPLPEYPVDWGAWGEDDYIELCELRLSTSPSGLVISTSRLPPLYGHATNLANMTFVSVPSGADEQNSIYLAASFLDFSDFASQPTSDIVLYGLFRDSSNGNTWACRQMSKRSFTDSVVAYMTCSAPGQSASKLGLFVGLMHPAGMTRRPGNSKREIQTGVIQVLKLPHLADHDLWGSSRIMTQIENAGRDVPLAASLSPNSCMMLCSTPLSFGASPIILYSLPRLKQVSSVPAPSQLAIAILTGAPTTDISHLLAHPSVTLSRVGETFLEAFKLLGNGKDLGRSTTRAIGLVLETYRTRAKRVSDAESSILELRWGTAFDMCSISSCNSAFGDCQQGDGFDLTAVWQLVALSTWIVTFVEKLLRECILVTTNADLPQAAAGAQPVATVGATTPIMLHIAHPVALKNLHAAVVYVNKFRNKIASLSATEESSHLAKSVLVDLIQCSGVNLNTLEPLLSELMADAAKFTVDDTHRSLACCEPTESMISHIAGAIEKLAQTAVLDRSRLFIKPSELIDGISPEEPRKDGSRDLVSKCAFQGHLPVMTCVRCGGKSEVGGGIVLRRHGSQNWTAWEKMWTKNCICGGAWLVRTL